MTAYATRMSVWQELGKDGNMHEVRDPAKIPAHLLTTEQQAALQKEVLRLRQKNAHRKQALRDLNAAVERKSYRLMNANIERGVMLDELEETYGKLRQARRRD